MDVRSTLLGCLMYSNMTGYGLKKYFSLSFAFFSGLSYGSIYPALKKMEQEGLISMTVEVLDGTPNRKVYSITDAGREAFIKALKKANQVEIPKSHFLTKLFFFANLSPEERLASAIQHLESVKQTQRELEIIGHQIEAEADPYQKLCYKFGVRYYRDIVSNLSEVVRTLEGLGETDAHIWRV
jgi:DNA-binding PadR family transcriptional regulator